MCVLPATGWCGLAGTGFPMGKADLPGKQGDSRGGEGEGLQKKGKTERVREPKGIQEVMRKEDRDYLLLFPIPVPSTHCPAFGAPGLPICSRTVPSQVWF